MNNELFQNVISLAKRRGFIFASSDIYGGLANCWDYGPLGVELKNNIKQAWWKRFVHQRQDIVGLDASIIMNPKVWEASGHIQGFVDPLVEDLKTHERYRLDHLLEENGVDIQNMNFEDMKNALHQHSIKSPNGNELDEPKHFNLMFETRLGATTESKDIVYLRPETAQAMFVDFKNIIDSTRVSVPFGVAQIGKAFRNEITPGNYIFRTREFEQMEIEYFVYESDWEKYFEEWVNAMQNWIEFLGINKERIHLLEVPEQDRAHYSKRTIDFEYDFPFGTKELYGLAYRGDYDLQQHQKHSGQALEYTNENGEKITPHTIEPSFGVDRTLLVLLLEAYHEEQVEGEQRVVLRFKPHLAPYKIAVLPLVKNEQEITQKAKNIFDALSTHTTALYDQGGTIGKRYRRNDEIGTPLCLTVDFDSLQDNSVTLRDRDSMKQVRIDESEITNSVTQHLSGHNIFI